MKIRKGTFKIRESMDGDLVWTSYDGSYGNDYPFYVHRKEDQTWWTLSHMSTGYRVSANLSLKEARRLAKALKEWPIFLMPTVETLVHQRSRLPSWKQEQLRLIVKNCGEQNEQ